MHIGKNSDFCFFPYQFIQYLILKKLYIERLNANLKFYSKNILEREEKDNKIYTNILMFSYQVL